MNSPDKPTLEEAVRLLTAIITDPHDSSQCLDALQGDTTGLLDLCKLLLKYKDLAYMDALTELPNRRAFIDAAIREVQMSLRTHRPSCLVMADADHFKKINDTFGHEAGDSVLQGLARRFQDALRVEDLCSRYGGEEFLILLRESTLEEGEKAAERLRQACENAPFTTGEHTIWVTASFGVTQMTPVSYGAPQGAQAILDQATQRADKALYIAKNAGRNKVYLC